MAHQIAQARPEELREFVEAYPFDKAVTIAPLMVVAWRIVGNEFRTTMASRASDEISRLCDIDEWEKAVEAFDNPVDRFAAEARLFCGWARDRNDRAELAARNALVYLTRLYLAALELPPYWSEELADQPDAKRIGEEECRAVSAACRRLPFDIYVEQFDPLCFPPEEPVVGSLTDDLGDIFRDVATGLREYEAGRRSQAVWEWGFGLRHHWGEHATGAIRALHCWLAANSSDRLAGKPDSIEGRERD
ncbi:MAG: DUF5063 domain-containing protein [Gemmataceae bacterium]